MSRILIELTNRCNLRCRHCFDERHASTGDIPLAIIDKVLAEGKPSGIHQVCFTGGEPTVHREFPEIIRRVCEAGYTFSFVSNGMNFPKIYPLLLQHREQLSGITFSLDGAREATHDHQRGDGSFRRVMRAASIAAVKAIPFTFNMVLTADNRGEIREMVELAAVLGSGGVRFGHLMFTQDIEARGLNLSPQQRRQVEAEIRQLRDGAPISIGIAPGHYSESPFFPCAPLELEEYNLDYRGNLTLCCQLSGMMGANDSRDVIGNLQDMSLGEALTGFRDYVANYLAAKRIKVERAEFADVDHFPCVYCAKFLGKMSLAPDHPWA